MGSKTTTATAEMDPIQKEYLTETLLPFAKDIAETAFTPFEGDRVAGMTELQKEALLGYGNLSTPEELQEATDIYRSLATRDPTQRAEQLADYTQQYTSNIIDPTMAALQRQREKARVGEEAAAIRSGAFGGDRRAVLEGERQGEFEARMGETLGQLQTQGYQSALARAAQEDASKLSFAQALAGGGLSELQAEQGILGAKMAAGETDRALTQQELDKAYEAYLAEMQYPLTQFGVLSGAGQAFPAGIGTTTSTVSDPMGTFGMGLQALGGFGMGGFGPFSSFAPTGGVTANPFNFFG